MNHATDAPVILIFGATGGIGSELAHRLAESAMRLVLGSPSRDALDRLAGETGGLSTPTDVTVPERWTQR